MATATYHRLPHLYDYAHALKHYNSTKPIRGRSPEVRPLGSRKDVDRFHIDKLDNGDVVCFLYRTPLVVFHVDDTLTVDLGEYRPSISDAYFIESVLGRGAGVRRRALVIVGKDWKIALTQDNPRITFVRDSNGLLMPPTGHANKGWQIDRTAANEVRAEYKEFYRYLKAALSLRRDEASDTVRANALEMKLALPVDPLTAEGIETYKKRSMTSSWNWFGMDPTTEPMENVWRFYSDDLVGYKPIEGKLYKSLGNDAKPRAQKRWEAAVDRFISLIVPTNDEAEQTTNFYKAFLWLVYWTSDRTYFNDRSLLASHSYWVTDEVAERVTYVSAPAAVRQSLDKLLFMRNSDRVLKFTDLKPGQVPNPHYSKWVD